VSNRGIIYYNNTSFTAVTNLRRAHNFINIDLYYSYDDEQTFFNFQS